jgi:hypothetical protein
MASAGRMAVAPVTLSRRTCAAAGSAGTSSATMTVRLRTMRAAAPRVRMSLEALSVWSLR